MTDEVLIQLIVDIVAFNNFEMFETDANVNQIVLKTIFASFLY